MPRRLEDEAQPARLLDGRHVRGPTAVGGVRGRVERVARVRERETRAAGSPAHRTRAPAGATALEAQRQHSSGSIAEATSWFHTLV